MSLRRTPLWVFPRPLGHTRSPHTPRSTSVPPRLRAPQVEAQPHPRSLPRPPPRSPPLTHRADAARSVPGPPRPSPVPQPLPCHPSFPSPRLPPLPSPLLSHSHSPAARAGSSAGAPRPAVTWRPAARAGRSGSPTGVGSRGTSVQPWRGRRRRAAGRRTRLPETPAPGAGGSVLRGTGLLGRAPRKASREPLRSRSLMTASTSGARLLAGGRVERVGDCNTPLWGRRQPSPL